MKGTVFHGPHDVRVERVDDPALQTPTDALVRITRAGICGSDLHFYHGAFPIEPGFVLGHEGVGVIEEVGSGVDRLKKGDRVVVSGLVACGRCFFCRRGQPSQCAKAARGFGYGASSAGKLGWLVGEQSERCAPRWPITPVTRCPPRSTTTPQSSSPTSCRRLLRRNQRQHPPRRHRRNLRMRPGRPMRPDGAKLGPAE